MVAIKIDSLTKIYHRRHLGKLYTTVGVEDISLKVFENEIFGLLGLNGSGKTTTIKLLLGLLFPTKGKIWLYDNLMPDRKALSLVGYLPEITYFPDCFTGYELLRFYSRLGGNTSEKLIDKVLDMVNLKPHANKRIKEFSKGMLQRLCIAQSLLHDPKLLLFDEPVSGLDPLGIKEMREFILTLKRLGKTIFFASHLISEVEKISDRVGILHEGKLVRIVKQDEWSQVSLEKIFLETVFAGVPK